MQPQWVEGDQCRPSMAYAEESIEMAEITVILSAAGLFVAGFVAWYTMWHRRVATAFGRVPVETPGTAHVVRRESGQRGDAL